MSEPTVMDQQSQDTQTTSSWRDEIPQELRGERLWESVPDLPTLMKNYVDMNKYTVGAIKVPGENASAEEYERFYGKLGRPEKPEGYQVPEAPDGISLNEQRLQTLRTVAHKEGLSAKQFAALASTWIDADRAQMQALREEADSVINGLKQDWGGAYDRKLGLAQRVLSSVFGEEVVSALQSSPLGNNRQFIEGLAKLGEQLTEHNVIQYSGSNLRTKDDIMAEAHKLMADPAYRDKKHVNHQQLVAQVSRLFEEAYN